MLIRLLIEYEVNLNYRNYLKLMLVKIINIIIPIIELYNRIIKYSFYKTCK